MRRRDLLVDVFTALALAAVLSAFALYLYHLGGGLIPRRNVYYNSDIDRVVANLIDRNSNYGRLTVHPLLGVVCIAFQHLFRPGADLHTAFAAWSAGQAALFALLVYAAVRVWGGARPVAIAGTLFAASSAAFVYWAPMVETHVLGGLTVVAVVIVARLQVANAVGQILQSAVMVALGASVVLTNVFAWVLSQLRLEGLFKPSFGALVKDNWRRMGLNVAGGLAGLGLLLLGMTAQDFVLRNPTATPLMRIWAETKYVSATRGSFLSPFDANALADGGRAWLWLLNAGMVAAVVWAVTRLGPRRAFIPLAALFGVVLHSVYDRSHAFLFSPNYLPVGVIAVALALSDWRPRLGAAALVVGALVLTPLNIQGYMAKRAAIAVQTDPPAFYDSLRQPHDVPPTSVVRPADPPIGFDQ